CLGFLLDGYSPTLDKPVNWTQLWHLSGCDNALPAASTNRNGRRYFSGLDKQYFWADFTLPGTNFASGSVNIGSVSSPVLLEKTASFHAVAYDTSAGNSCELSSPNTICEVMLTWFTDGNYPNATVFAHNNTSNSYYRVLKSTQPVMRDITYQLPTAGTYNFELHMGDGVPTTLIAESPVFTVTASVGNSPPVLTKPAEQFSDMGETVELLLIATDPDAGDVLAFSASGLPAGLALDSATGRISGTLSAAAGVYPVNVIVQDDHSNSDTESFIWNVLSQSGDPETPPSPASPPDMTPSNSSSKVGATVGEFSVDESGSATYSIPILSAPASGGLTPKISLNYSSQAGNGEVGVGWTVGGVSAIVLCPQTMEQDGVSGSRGIKLDGDDRFCLDGQRLVVDPSSGAYGDNGTRYRTEIDSFTRITSYGSAGNGPAWFKVERKDGSVLEFGNSTDSRIEARGSVSPSTAFAWAQNHFEDRFGNYMLYSYAENSSGSVGYVLKSIDYTGNSRAGTLPSARMSFSYIKRSSSSDLTYSYFAGVQFGQSLLLRSILSEGRLQASSALQDLRFYALEYEDDGVGRKILTTLTECRSSSRSTCYQPTRFSWLKSESMIDTAATVQSGLLPKSTLSGLLLADVSGDGRADILYTKTKSNRHYLYVKQATVTAGFTEWPTNYQLPKKSDGRAPRVFAIDINSDGIQDVVYSKYSKTSSDYTWVTRISDGTGFQAETVLNAAHRFILNSTSMESRFRIMDFNGDGLSDILHAHARVAGNDWQLTVLLNTTTPGGTPGLSAPIAVNVDNADLFPDLLTGGWEPNNFPPIYGWASNEYEKTDIPDARIFDFNGDGDVDLLLKVWRNYRRCIANCQFNAPAAGGGNGKGGKGGGQKEPVYEVIFASFWVLMESDGQNTFTRHSIVARGESCTALELCDATEYTNLPRSNNVWPVDINADGLADLAWGETDGKWYFQLNTGNGYTTASFIGLVPEGTSELTRFEDWNGDGYPDLVYPSAILDDNAKWMLYQNHFGREFAASMNTQIPAGNVGGERDSDPVENDSSVFADFDGDGKTDQLLIDNNQNGEILSTTLRKGMNVSGSRAAEPANVVTSISNGFGMLTEISYRPLTDAVVYTRMYDSAAANWGQGSPVYDFIAPIYVVSDVAGSSPIFSNQAALSRAEYHYVGAKLQAGGRGLLGFAEIIVYDPQLQIRTNTRYRQDFPFIGLPVDTVRVISAPSRKLTPVTAVLSKQMGIWPTVTSGTKPPSSINGTLLSYNVNHWQEKQMLTDSWQVYSDTSLQRTYTLSGNFESKEFTQNTFDSNGNIITADISIFAEDSDIIYSSRTTKNKWSGADLVTWELGKLVNSSITHSRTGLPTVVRQSAFEYAGTTGALIKEFIEPGSATLEIGTTFSYDLFGNRTTTSIKGAAMQNRTSTVTYEPLGRFVVLEIDALGQTFRKVNSLNWDVFGNPLEIENIDGVLSINAIDLMGRPFAAYKQTGVWQKTLNYAGSGTNCPTGTSWHSISTHGGGAETRQCFDVAGRNIRNIGKGINGQLISVDQYYDLSGRPARLSEPYFNADSPLWNQTSYDKLGRITGLLSAGSDDISTSYDEQAVNSCTTAGPRVIVTTNALGQQATEVKNVLGETISSF
ncbi:MAG: hypothetical protein GQ538_13220, partial [Xanthomonadales bacterium]|nr:hypothetical protein [Xanthomonadales bacterium]